jgi:hypothetical protein
VMEKDSKAGLGKFSRLHIDIESNSEFLTKF